MILVGTNILLVTLVGDGPTGQVTVVRSTDPRLFAQVRRPDNTVEGYIWAGTQLSPVQAAAAAQLVIDATPALAGIHAATLLASLPVALVNAAPAN